MYVRTLLRTLVVTALLLLSAAGAMAQTILVPAQAPTIGDAIAMAQTAATVVDGGGAFSVLTLIDVDNTVAAPLSTTLTWWPSSATP